ncbi:hypothetical protein HELRODRAFT_109424 [Helobdella robusta]|uniref:Cationic amino acid transporter C-terminal domain-containing protein n=1 Tax=Helobdella robusta TaxID=6412 RepID=T1EET7_HELRO|nr:hypothetical protein HELRODRAFT_109424 [Helobdella robusta]ESO10076.1 hypothetical protein HELRODRAFT_109424 [Helobdella robusta]
MKCGKLQVALARRKSIRQTLSIETNLKKCLSTFDLISLGIGCTLGCGIYVVTGEVIRNITGPSVVLSFLIAAFASMLAAFSYAEFGARVPRAGSAYIYSYVTVGEGWAFVIGWNLILEYVIGAASTAKAISTYLDSLMGKKISTAMVSVMPLNTHSLSPYPDFVAFGFVALLTVIVCIGIHESSFLNNIFTLINISILVFVIFFGAFQIDTSNWSIPTEKVRDVSICLASKSYQPSDYGTGGFFPFGYLGVMAGASICFYSYIGFDVITVAGEETVSPQKSIPISIMVSLLVCSTAYVLLSAVLTMMVPYYSLDPESPISSAFSLLGWKVPAIVINIGAVVCIISSLLTYVLAMPRIFYAMASDGLLFKFLGNINQRFKTPVNATLVSGLFTGILSMFFELIDLVNMMSIGTLLAYTLVSICVLLLRYKPEVEQKDNEMSNIVHAEADEKDMEMEVANKKSFVNKLKCLCFLSPDCSSAPNKKSFMIVSICLALIVLLTLLNTMMAYLWFYGWIPSLVVVICFVALFFLLTVYCIIIIANQPKHKPELSFLVPLVPLLPIVSVIANIYLMLNLSKMTWLRFLIWMIIGIFIYFGYGMHHSSEINETKELKTGAKEDYNKLEGLNEESKIVPNESIVVTE